MKKSLWIKILKSIIIITGICVIVFLGEGSVTYDNLTPKNDLLTEKYSVEKIQEFKDRMYIERVTFFDFKKAFHIQCVRKTHQGYYSILLTEDGQTAFAFFDETKKLVDVVIVREFKTKDEFQLGVSLQMSQSQLLQFDSATVFLHISAVGFTAHIVQEGVYIVRCSRFIDKNLVLETHVESVRFIENSSLSTNESSIPFIYEFDKLNE